MISGYDPLLEFLTVPIFYQNSLAVSLPTVCETVKSSFKGSGVDFFSKPGMVNALTTVVASVKRAR